MAAPPCAAEGSGTSRGARLAQQQHRVGRAEHRLGERARGARGQRHEGLAVVAATRATVPAAPASTSAPSGSIAPPMSVASEALSIASRSCPLSVERKMWPRMPKATTAPSAATSRAEERALVRRGDRAPGLAPRRRRRGWCPPRPGSAACPRPTCTIALRCLSSAMILRAVPALAAVGGLVDRPRRRPPRSPVSCDTNSTSRSGRCSEGAENCCVQVSPPSAVARMTESWPTAQPCCASTKSTAVSSGAVGRLGARPASCPVVGATTM